MPSYLSLWPSSSKAPQMGSDPLAVEPGRWMDALPSDCHTRYLLPPLPRLEEQYHSGWRYISGLSRPLSNKIMIFYG